MWIYNFYLGCVLKYDVNILCISTMITKQVQDTILGNCNISECIVRVFLETAKSPRDIYISWGFYIIQWITECW